jgi:hypothetical protein
MGVRTKCQFQLIGNLSSPQGSDLITKCFSSQNEPRIQAMPDLAYGFCW